MVWSRITDTISINPLSIWKLCALCRHKMVFFYYRCSFLTFLLWKKKKSIKFFNFPNHPWTQFLCFTRKHLAVPGPSCQWVFHEGNWGKAAHCVSWGGVSNVLAPTALCELCSCERHFQLLCFLHRLWLRYSCLMQRLGHCCQGFSLSCIPTPNLWWP